jgi:hypothetical protein
MRLINKKNQAKPPLQKCARQRQRKVMLLILIIIQHAAGCCCLLGDGRCDQLAYIFYLSAALGCGVCAGAGGCYFLFI